MSKPPPDTAILVKETAWLAGLVRRLVEDADADDVAQETIRRALRAGSGTRSARARLGAIARNVARAHHRTTTRRERREQAAARPATTSDEITLVERLERQRAVVDAVLGLGEPYRRTILLRFWEGLGPAAIAAADDVSVETVKTRLRRGLALLRDHLAELDEAWCLTFLPLAIERPARRGFDPRVWLLLIPAVGLLVIFIILVRTAGQLMEWIYR